MRNLGVLGGGVGGGHGSSLHLCLRLELSEPICCSRRLPLDRRFILFDEALVGHLICRHDRGRGRAFLAAAAAAKEGDECDEEEQDHDATHEQGVLELQHT